MAICISGNIDPEETFEIIEKYFSAWENPEPLREEPKWSEEPLKWQGICTGSVSWRRATSDGVQNCTQISSGLPCPSSCRYDFG